MLGKRPGGQAGPNKIILKSSSAKPVDLVVADSHRPEGLGQFN